MKRALNWCAMAMLPLLATGQQAANEFERPVDHYAYAQGLMKGKVYDYAQKAFEGFLKAYPEHELSAAAFASLIDCLRRQEKHDEMILRIGEYRKKWPKNDNLEVFTFWEGESRLQRKMIPQAKECFESLLNAKKPVLKEYSMFLLAGCLFAEDPASARGYELYAQLAELPLQKEAPFREQALYKLGKKYQYDMKFDQALALFKRLEAFADANPAVREDALFSIGEIHFAKHEYKEARTAYDRYLTVFQKGKWANEVRKRRASAVYLNDQFEEALKMILEWRAVNPGLEDAEVDCLQGRCLYSLGEYMTAWPHFQVVIKNEKAPVELRRFCIVHAIHCLLADDKTDSWERGLELSRLYFKSFSDAIYENKVTEFEARLQENLGHFDQAISAYDRTLKGLGADETTRRIQISLRKVQCCQVLKRWKEAAEMLRALAAEQECRKERIKYLCGAAELELKNDDMSIAAEADYLKTLTFEEISAEQSVACRERLLGIYSRRKDHPKAHAQLEMLLKNATGDTREQYLYRDAWVLDEMNRRDEAISRLREALDKTSFSDEARETSMRFLLLKLLQEKLNAGEQAVGDDILVQYRILATKPETLTDGTLTSPVLSQMAQLLEKRLEKQKSQADRALLEQTCRRAVKMELNDAHAIWMGYRLGCLYMEPQDRRFAPAAKLFEQLAAVLKARLEDKDKNAELQNAEYLLRDVLSRLSVCYFELGKDADAQTTADMVLSRGQGFAATRRSLMIQARIYYERNPKNLKMAMEKLAAYLYTVAKEPVDPQEEEEAMLLLLKVQRDLGRTQAAMETLRQLKVHYPQRVEKEQWLADFEKNNKSDN